MIGLLSAVCDYIDRGWSPIPIPHCQKGPLIDAWQDLRINAETAAAYFNGARQNVGVILGPASGGLADFDLDCAEAIRAAPYILPRTAVFGHASKRASHWIYRTNLSETQDRAAIKLMGSDKTGLLEIRMGAGGLAAQTVFPPSTHVSGEAIEWEGRGPGEIADVDGEELIQCARRLAAASELARNYPKIGGRHDAAFVLGGFLTRCGFTPPAAALFVEAVGAASLQPGDKRRDMKRTARDGANAGKRAGSPALAETFGERPATKVADWLGYAGELGERPIGGDKAADSGPRPSPADDRPTVKLLLGKTEQAVNELETLLVASGRGLYRRGGLVVSTSFAEMLTWDGKKIIGQVIETRGDYALVEDAEAVAKFVRFDEKGEPRPCPPPMSLIRTLKDRKLRLRLPLLAGIVNCPSIAVDGRLLDQPGYDPVTGVLYDPLGVSFPRVPDFPDRGAAEKAMVRVLQLLDTFDLVTPDDKAVAQSLMFSAIARRGLPFVPLHGFDAPVAGSGKSMLVDIASILATGHEAGVTAYGETREEAEKRLSSVLMRGDPIVALDNCEASLEGVLLNQALTQHQVELRILGQSKMVSTQTKALFAATGNNLIVKGDATRRSVVGKLDPRCERPELRQFAYDPIADAKENRGEIVAAILTVLRAYHVAGLPNKPAPLQSFVHWSNTVRGALLWLGQGDPVRTMARLRKVDPALVNLRAVLAVWRDEFGDAPQTSSGVIETANATIATPEPGTSGHFVRTHVHPALRNALLAVAGRSGAIDVRVLGKWLGSYKDRVINLSEDDGAADRVALEQAGILDGYQQWRVVNRAPAQ